MQQNQWPSIFLVKGQIISEQNCVSQIFQKSNEINVRISALASKMGQIKELKAIYYIRQ